MHAFRARSKHTGQCMRRRLQTHARFECRLDARSAPFLPTDALAAATTRPYRRSSARLSRPLDCSGPGARSDAVCRPRSACSASFQSFAPAGGRSRTTASARGYASRTCAHSLFPPHPRQPSPGLPARPPRPPRRPRRPLFSPCPGARRRPCRHRPLPASQTGRVSAGPRALPRPRRRGEERGASSRGAGPRPLIPRGPPSTRVGLVRSV